MDGYMDVDGTVIREIMFFATGGMDFFLALVSEGSHNFRLAGRVQTGSGKGDGTILISSVAPREELEEKMKSLAGEYAAAFDVKCVHLVFTEGIGTEEFIDMLRSSRCRPPFFPDPDGRRKHETIN